MAEDLHVGDEVRIQHEGDIHHNGIGTVVRADDSCLFIQMPTGEIIFRIRRNLSLEEALMQDQDQDSLTDTNNDTTNTGDSTQAVSSAVTDTVPSAAPEAIARISHGNAGPDPHDTATIAHGNEDMDIYATFATLTEAIRARPLEERTDIIRDLQTRLGREIIETRLEIEDVIILEDSDE